MEHLLRQARAPPQAAEYYTREAAERRRIDDGIVARGLKIRTYAPTLWRHKVPYLQTQYGLLAESKKITTRSVFFHQWE